MRGHFHRHVGYRGSFLLAFAVIDLTYAIYLFTTPVLTSSINRWFGSIASLWLWGIYWLVVGLVCLAHAFADSDLPGFQAAITIKLVWGLGCLFGWCISDVPLSQVAVWLVFSWMVWRISGWPEPAMSGKDHPHDA